MARNTARSVIDGMTFSTPITATCTRGSDVVMRPLPSLVTRTTVPVSATAKLAPVIPRSAWRNFSRNSSRAIFVRTSGSAARPGRCSSRENSPATCPFVLWMAGAMMCEGRSWASWMMYSPRSVSTGVTPIASSASLRWISSVAIDLDFTAMRAPVRLAMSRMIRRASSAVVAKCTWPPTRSTLATSVSRCASSRWSVASLMARARSRSASPWGKSPKASRRSAMNFVVAMSSASCRKRSRRALEARSRRGVVTIGSLIDRRGGPGYGPPDPSSERGYAPLGLPRPSLGRAPAQPWRASDLTQDVSSRGQRQPAVHHERLARDPACLVAGEIDGGPADVPRRALDAERDRTAPALAHLRTEVLDHRSPHRPGRDRVDANRFRRELVRHADDEAEDAGLGRGVRGTPGAADRRHRRHARHGAAAAPLEGGHGGLSREQHRLEVHRHHTVPLVLGRIHQRLARLDADVVVQHVEPAPAADGLGHHRLAVRLVGDVGGEGERLALLRADEPDRLLRAVLLRVHAEHARALARHEDRGGLAVAHARTARARAGHDRDLAGESFAHWGRVLLGP